MIPYSNLSLYNTLSLYNWMVTNIHNGHLSSSMLRESHLLEEAADRKGFRMSHYAGRSLVVVHLNKHRSSTALALVSIDK
ncbi:hypothetical protein LCM20_09610 [Halobacillus litoralis]|uniref:hypothetical protein n=1 Tax=Halobacillus litoralis TaxID=45668 RepID=UPI001CD424D5|nr:hypothetical protein [Halobacillus litoralis]MCA0970846.1 hypothetical protein [Halobacillus litoralis]